MRSWIWSTTQLEIWLLSLEYDHTIFGPLFSSRRDCFILQEKILRFASLFNSKSEIWFIPQDKIWDFIRYSNPRSEGSSQYKETILPVKGIPISFIMGIPILGKTIFILKRPRFFIQQGSLCITKGKIVPQTSDISCTLVQWNCWSLRCSWSISCGHCSNYIFILDLTPGFNRLHKDNCKMRWETFKFGGLVHLILEVWW